MPSLADIPEELLLHPDNDNFWKWLDPIPVNRWTKKDILFLWVQFTGKPVSRSEIVEHLGDV